MSDLMTAKEVAEIFGVSRVTVGRWAKNGVLPGIQISPRTLRFERSIVEALRKSGKAS